MTKHETSTLGADELSVTIQAGDAYQATPRLKAALDELAVALQEAEEYDTAGFADPRLGGGGFSMLYNSPVDRHFQGGIGRSARGRGRNDSVEHSWDVALGKG